MIHVSIHLSPNTHFSSLTMGNAGFHLGNAEFDIDWDKFAVIRL